MEFFLILIGLFGLIGLLTGIDSGTHDNHPFEDNDPFDNNLFGDEFYRHHSFDDDNGMCEIDINHDSDDGLLDPFPTTPSDNLFDTDNFGSSFDDLSHSDDIIMDPEYSSLECNIYHDDSLD